MSPQQSDPCVQPGSDLLSRLLVLASRASDQPHEAAGELQRVMRLHDGRLLVRGKDTTMAQRNALPKIKINNKQNKSQTNKY